MTTNEPKREPGYRGALPTREDTLGRNWILIVIGIFVLVIVLAFLGVPSRFIPDPTPVPLPSVPVPTESASPSVSGSPDESGSAEPSGSAASSNSPSASPSATP